MKGGAAGKARRSAPSRRDPVKGRVEALGLSTEGPSLCPLAPSVLAGKEITQKPAASENGAPGHTQISRVLTHLNALDALDPQPGTPKHAEALQ